MPALPWKTLSNPDTNGDYLVVASTLPLRRYRRVPAFLPTSLTVRKQLEASPGLIGYALDADLVHKTFRTLSVWRDEAAMSAFARAHPHVEIMAAWQPHLGETAIVTWTSREPRPGWDEAGRRLTA